MCARGTCTPLVRLLATRHPLLHHKTLFPVNQSLPSFLPARGTPPPPPGRSSLHQILTMGLVVLALRCYLVFQNVFITFKTLKLPPPSSRNGGRPSIRALTQRKRDMKGCMAIWIVWVSRLPFGLRSDYSRVCSSAVWLFMNH